MFVSTLDGQVTAIDARRGTEKWSLQAGSTLLSSSIHRLDVCILNRVIWFFVGMPTLSSRNKGYLKIYLYNFKLLESNLQYLY